MSIEQTVGRGAADRVVLESMLVGRGPVNRKRSANQSNVTVFRL